MPRTRSRERRTQSSRRRRSRSYSRSRSRSRSSKYTQHRRRERDSHRDRRHDRDDRHHHYDSRQHNETHYHSHSDNRWRSEDIHHSSRSPSTSTSNSDRSLPSMRSPSYSNSSHSSTASRTSSAWDIYMPPAMTEIRVKLDSLSPGELYCQIKQMIFGMICYGLEDLPRMIQGEDRLNKSRIGFKPIRDYLSKYAVGQFDESWVEKRKLLNGFLKSEGVVCSILADSVSSPADRFASLFEFMDSWKATDEQALTQAEIVIELFLDDGMLAVLDNIDSALSSLDFVSPPFVSFAKFRRAVAKFIRTVDRSNCGHVSTDVMKSIWG